MDDLERRIRDRQIKVLEEEIEEVHLQWEAATSDEQRLMLQRRIDQKFDLLRKLKGNGNNERQEERNISGLSQNITPQNNDADAIKAFERGYEQEQKGESRLALIEYTEALRLKPNYVLAYVRRGLTFTRLNEKEIDVKDFKTAMNLSVYTYEDYCGIGIAKSNLGDKEGAIADFNKAIHLKPDLTDAYYNRGLAKSELGDKQGAIADYDEAIRLNPNYTEAYNNRGEAKYELGDAKGAINDYNKALSLNYKDNDIYFSRGVAYYCLGYKEAAIADYNIAIIFNPSNPHAYYSRGLIKKETVNMFSVFLGNSNKKEALADFQKAAELYKLQGNTEWYNKSRDRIRELG
jgi:tetratricopeptide (TPR) repeat protein